MPPLELSPKGPIVFGQDKVGKRQVCGGEGLSKGMEVRKGHCVSHPKIAHCC